MSDRMITGGSVSVYAPNNSYYYDNKSNYEPDAILEPLTEDARPLSRKPYRTFEVIGDNETTLKSDIWYRLEEIPDSYTSSSGYIWSSDRNEFRVPKMIYGRRKTPYLVVYSKIGMFYLHRLMAKYFIPNPYDYPIVRHLDDDGLNCQLSNLAWGTQKDNVADAIKNGNFKGLRLDEVRSKGNSARSCPVIAINLEDGTEILYPSTKAAADAFDISQALVSCIISGKVKNRYKTARKFTFRRASECP